MKRGNSNERRWTRQRRVHFLSKLQNRQYTRTVKYCQTVRTNETPRAYTALSPRRRIKPHRQYTQYRPTVTTKKAACCTARGYQCLVFE